MKSIVYWPYCFDMPLIKKSFNTLCSDKIHYHPAKWIPCHQTNFLVIEWERCLKFQCTLVHWIIDCWDNDFHLLYFFTWHKTSYYKWMGKLAFFRQASLYSSLEVKAPAFLTSQMQFPDSSLNILFLIQSMTAHNCFSVLLCLGVSAGVF